MVLALLSARVDGCARRVGLPAVIATALTLGGCESLPAASSGQLAFRTTPPGAEVKASSGESCSTPCILQLSQGGGLTVVVSKRGFQTERFEVGERCASAVDIALRPIASITAFELPDRDLPLIADCERRTTGRAPAAADLAPVH
jgi:hypothetical protein